MPIYELMGYKRVSGEYNGQSYDNLNLYCRVVHSDEVDGLVGEEVSIIKIKFSLVSEKLELGVLFTPLYDRFGRVMKLDFDC